MPISDVGFSASQVTNCFFATNEINPYVDNIMAATVQTLIEFVLLNYGKPTPDFRKKAAIISNHFGDLQTFLSAPAEVLLNLEYVGGKKIGLTPGEIVVIKKLQEAQIIDAKLSIQENFCKVLAERFIKRQLDMVKALTIPMLNCNPILIKSLRLNTPQEVMGYYVFQAISRSVVTSLGFLVQNLLLYSGVNVFNAKDEMSGDDTKWDLLKEKVGEIKAWIEVKSGPNDLDKAQILHYKREIETIEKNGERAFIGETYGKRDQNTITHSLYKQYLPEWERRTLIGHELWDFISDDSEYHIKLTKMLHDVAGIVLAKESLLAKIEEKVQELTEIFKQKYKTVDQFVADLW